MGLSATYLQNTDLEAFVSVKRNVQSSISKIHAKN